MSQRQAAPQLTPYRARTAAREAALAGIRVIDFTHFIAGPLATMILGDLGADVVKIENAAGGDNFRAFMPRIDGESGPFMWVNRNKRSLALDLGNASARQLAHELIAGADIVVENFSSQVMTRFGLDYETVSAGNPRLIYCSVSAYGRDGSLADRTGFDPVVQAETGFMSLNGEDGRDPLRTGPAVMDMATAMMASNAILAALAARNRTGRGQRIEVCLFDVATTMLGFHAMNYLLTGNTPRRFGNNSFDTAPMGVFHAADGPLYLAIANDRLFRNFCRDVMGRAELADMPEFATNRDRVTNRDHLFEVLGAIFASADRKEWLQRTRRAGIPAGAVRTLAEAFASEEMNERGLATSIAHPRLGSIPNIASPLRFDETPVVDPVAAPMLNQHCDEILRELGYDEARCAALAAAGAFGTTDSKRD